MVIIINEKKIITKEITKITNKLLITFIYNKKLKLSKLIVIVILRQLIK